MSALALVVADTVDVELAPQSLVPVTESVDTVVERDQPVGDLGTVGTTAVVAVVRTVVEPESLARPVVGSVDRRATSYQLADRPLSVDIPDCPRCDVCATHP